MADALEIDGSYSDVKEQVEAGDVEDLSVEEEYAVRHRILDEMYQERRDAIDEYRRDKRLRGFDKKAKKRSYKNKAGIAGAGVGTPAGGLAAIQTLGVAGSVLALPVVAGAAAAGGIGAGLASYYGMGKAADTALDARNRYVETKADAKERLVDVRESLDRTILDVKERKDAGLEQVTSLLGGENAQEAPDT